jgi:hypothetical protein
MVESTTAQTQGPGSNSARNIRLAPTAVVSVILPSGQGFFMSIRRRDQNYAHKKPVSGIPIIKANFLYSLVKIKLL